LADDVENWIAVKTDGALEALDDNTGDAGGIGNVGIVRAANSVAALDGTRKVHQRFRKPTQRRFQYLPGVALAGGSRGGRNDTSEDGGDEGSGDESLGEHGLYDEWLVLADELTTLEPQTTSLLYPQACY
jgi:hypothetical protein